jgi:hypothetical protein
MRNLSILLTLAAIAGAAPSDSLALARFRADSTLAAGFLREARSLDSAAVEQHAKARDRTVQAQTTYDLAVWHLSQDTAHTRAGK